MKNIPDVSVVVPTFNRCQGLEELLRALAQQTYPADRFEVVVVDDGSSDGTSELLRTIQTPYVLRSLCQANGGPAVARNRGVEHAQGDLIVFLDDDIVPLPELLAMHVAAHGSTADQVVIGPMSPPPAHWPQPAWDRWDAVQLQKQYLAMLAGSYSCTNRQFYTANASLRRQLFLRVGGFDPAFRRAEDLELAWRLNSLGAGFRFEPQADATHYAARPFASWQRNAYQYGVYDVIMSREKGIPTFELACREFHSRRFANRWLARLCVGRRPLRESTIFGLALVTHAATRLGAHRIATLALSSIFALKYWQGVSDELDDPNGLWRSVDAQKVLARSQRTQGHGSATERWQRRNAELNG